MGSLKGASIVYQELGLESLKDIRWHQNFCSFHKNANRFWSKYLQMHLKLHNNQTYQSNLTAKNSAKHIYPHCSQEWNSLTDDIKLLPLRIWL